MEQVVRSVLLSASSGIFDLLFWLLILSIIGALAGFIYWITRYKHKVLIRYITKNGKYIVEDKAKLTNVDGTPVWRLLKMKVDVRPPPPESINIMKGGKFFAECYWSDDNPSPAWLTDTGRPDDSFSKQAFTSVDRAFYVASQKKALELKGTSLFEKISRVALPMALIIIVMIPFIFWGDITKSATDTMKEMKAISDNNVKIAEQNARILSVLAGKIEMGEINITQDVNTPPDAIGGGE